MNKSQLLDKIVREWAFRSPDGLALGPHTEENQKILLEILSEIPKPTTKNKPPSEISETMWEEMASRNGKNIGREGAVNAIKAAIKEFDTTGEFIKLYNTCNLNKAINVYSDPKFANIINAIDGFVAQGLGKGELVFLYLLKGAKSGGTKDVDLMNVDGGMNIELKEKTRSDIKISLPTLKGVFDTDFMGALSELVSELQKNPKIGDFLLKVLLGDSPELYPADRVANPKEIDGLTNFFKKKNITEIGGSVFTGLSLIGTKLARHTQNKSGGKSMRARAAVVIGQDRADFRLNDPVGAKAAVDKVETDPTDDSLTIRVTPAPDKSDKDMEEDAKEFRYFKLGLNRQKITEELLPLLREKFSGLLIIDKQRGNKASYIDSHSIKFDFVAITINKLMFNIK